MPLVRIYASRFNDEPSRRAAGDAVHEAMVESISIPPAGRFQLFLTLTDSAMSWDPAYGDVERKGLVVVEITLNAGRSIEVKKSLYAALARKLEERAGVRPDDLVVTLVETSRENWSFGGGRATYA
jgi:4-oxalocrotonate tautomerase